MTLRRLFPKLLLVLACIGAVILVWGYLNAVSEPTVRRAELQLNGWPAGAPPVRAVLLSDIHVAAPDMPTERLRRIVAQVNALRPDLVLIAGDLVSDKDIATRHYSTRDSIAPLAGLKPRLGTIAVLGNHDHWRDEEETKASLAAAGIKVLDNSAVRAGPLAVGGLDDAYTDHANPAGTVARMRALPGAKVLLSHSPDPFARLPRDIGLMLAGHTHCGQVVVPLIGTPVTFSDYGERYACGRIEEGRKTLIVGAGLGTSMLPIRIGTVPEIWLLELGPVTPGARL
jgi:predicted MPP superfamily phosphohydrolase